MALLSGRLLFSLIAIIAVRTRSLSEFPEVKNFISRFVLLKTFVKDFY